MKTIAAFDFDGTLTHRDTLLPFLFFTQGPLKTLLAYLRTLPYFLQYFTGTKTRQQIKERLLESSLSKSPYTQLAKQGEQFALQHLDNHLVQTRIERLAWHKSQGHLCVLISANLDLFILPWGEKWGFDATMCSIVEHNEDKITGKLVGLNCWGDEKVRRLLAWAGPKEDFILYAYGNSRGDIPLLELADFPFKF